MPTNFTKTAVLLAVLTLIFVGMGAAVGGANGLLVAFAIALVMNLFALWKSDSIVLKLHQAQEVGPQDAPQYYAIVQEMARRAELPMPRVCIMHNPQPNAFAVGRNPANSAVCASTGLLEMLDVDEVAGVMAHELAHVKNRDTLTMTVAATLGGAISMLAQWLQVSMLFGRGSSRGSGNWLVTLAVMIGAPFAAMIVQMAVSRSREYQADRLGALISGNPMALASALGKIQERVRGIPNPVAEAVPATAHLFIMNPLTGRGFDNFFSTHPDTANRIAELQKLATEMAAAGHRVQTAGGDGRLPPQGIAPTDASAGNSGPWSRSRASNTRTPRGPWG